MSDTIKSFRRSIAKIKAQGESLATLTHETGVAMAEHAKEHGDMTLFVDLFNALHTGQRRLAFRLWLHDFTPIRLKVKDDVAMAKGSRLMKEGEKDYTPWDIDGLRAVTYWDYSKEKDPKALDADTILKAIERLSKRFEKALEKGTVAPDLDVGAANAYLSKLAAIQPGELRVVHH